MWPRGPTTFTAGFAMPLSKIVSRWTLSTKDYFRSFCMWWGPVYSHEDWDIAKRAIEPIKRSLSKTSQYGEFLYKTLLCLFAEWTLMNNFVWYHRTSHYPGKTLKANPRWGKRRNTCQKCTAPSQSCVLTWYDHLCQSSSSCGVSVSSSAQASEFARYHGDKAPTRI